MNEQKYKTQLRNAEEMRRITEDPLMSEYWAGYARGLRRGYHGDKFGTEEEHNTWSALVESKDKARQSKGRGYIDGINCVLQSGKMGRPSVGDVMLPAITVEEDTKKTLERIAEEKGMSVAEVRRDAYRFYGEHK